MSLEKQAILHSFQFRRMILLIDKQLVCYNHTDIAVWPYDQAHYAAERVTVVICDIGHVSPT